MNRRILALFVSLAVFSPAFVLAHEDEVFTQVREKPVQVRKQVVEERRTLKIDVSQKIDALKTEIKEKQDAFKADTQLKREVIKREAKNLTPQSLKETREILRKNIKKEREDIRLHIKEKREVFREEAKERVEAFKNKVSEEKAKRIEALFGTMARKFEAAISRLRILADRIEFRIDKFEDAGKDIAELRSSLDKARAVIDESENALDSAKEEFNTFATNDSPQEYFAKVKEAIAGVAQKVKDAHKALIDVINSIKGASNVSQ